MCRKKMCFLPMAETRLRKDKTMPFSFTVLDWDSAHFGVPCAKVKLTKSLTCDEWERLICAIRPYRFVTVQNSDMFSENTRRLSSLSNALETDITVHLKNTCGKCAVPVENNALCVSLTECTSLSSDTIALCRGTFLNSRFYHDPHITKKQADGVFTSWLTNAQSRAGTYICTATYENHPAGFLLFHDADEKTIQIELVGTCDKARGIGMGTAMMARLFSHCNVRGITTVLVGTQFRNEIARNFYRKNYFTEDAFTHIFHIWNE